ncbi:MAG: hypothetical protein KTR32_26465 [Granulosicoccus sp.]|nr:hypothetical protein [Granulosicoccus sp.]
MNNTVPRIHNLTQSNNEYRFFALGADYRVTTRDHKVFDTYSFHYYDKSERSTLNRSAQELSESGLMWPEFLQLIGVKVDKPDLFPADWELLPP